MIKAILCLALHIGSVATISAQQPKYEVGLSYGFYKAPDYKQAVNKPYLGADFDYAISDRWTVSSGFMSGKFAYFEDWLSNAYRYDSYTNADGYESHATFSVLYSVIRSNKFLLKVGSGIGLFTQRLKYPYASPSSGGAPSQVGGDVFISEESKSYVELPVKVVGYYQVIPRIGVGFKAGLYVLSTGNTAGLHVGPQIRIGL